VGCTLRLSCLHVSCVYLFNNIQRNFFKRVFLKMDEAQHLSSRTNSPVLVSRSLSCLAKKSSQLIAVLCTVRRRQLFYFLALCIGSGTTILFSRKGEILDQWLLYRHTTSCPVPVHALVMRQFLVLIWVGDLC
jgi:hypothetical protein